jgi:hypothetical protein
MPTQEQGPPRRWSTGRWSTGRWSRDRWGSGRPSGGRPAAILILAAAAVAAGCTTGPASHAGPGSSAVASLPGHTASAAAGPSLTEAGSDQAMVSFTRCMRSHGVQMADPSHRPGHAGLSIDLPTPVAATRAAYAACNHFIAKIIQAKQAGAAVAESPAQLAALTRYAQCMRGRDIPMLDPTPQGQLNLGDVPGVASTFGRYSPQFRAADTACRHLLPAGVRDNGTGP